MVVGNPEDVPYAPVDVVTGGSGRVGLPAHCVESVLVVGVAIINYQCQLRLGKWIVILKCVWVCLSINPVYILI